MKLVSWWISIVVMVIGCGGARPTPVQPQPPEEPPATALACDARQAEISREADTRAAPWSIAQHLAKNFPDGRIAWLMPDDKYQQYIVTPGAQKWGRCNDTGCFLFVSPAAVIHTAVEQATSNGAHDPAALGKALGLPAANFQGTLRMMTLDLDEVSACARLPVDADPGVWPCKTAEDTDCFKFGGYTSGGLPELMVIDAPVDRTTIVEVP